MIEVGQGEENDQSQEHPMASKTVRLVMEFHRLYRFSHWQAGGGCIGPGFYAGRRHPDYHRDRCHRWYSTIHYRVTVGNQGIVVSHIME